MVCGYDSDPSLASPSDGSSLFVRVEEAQSRGSPVAWAQWLSSEQGSGLRHHIHVGQWDRAAAWVRRIDGRLEYKEYIGPAPQASL